MAKMNEEKNKKLPFVSIIVLNYNGKEHLKDCFESLEKLNYPRDKYEVIMVDNASSDDSVEYTKNDFKFVRVIEFDKNYGFTKGNNMAVKYAKGSYVAFLNNDTKVDKDWLIEGVKVMEDHDDIAMCGSKVKYFDKANIIQSMGTVVLPSGDGIHLMLGEKDNKTKLKDNPKNVASVMGASMLVKKEIFEEVGGFDEDFFMYSEETDMAIRMWICGYKVVVVPRSVIYHVGGGGLFSPFQIYHSNRNRIGVILKNFEIQNCIKGLVIAFFYDCARMILFLKNKDFKNLMALIRGDIDSLKTIHLSLNKRRKIQKKRKVSDKYLSQIGVIGNLSYGVRTFLKRIKSQYK